MARSLALALLASGEGTTYEGLVGAVEAGRLPARIVLVLTDRPEAPVLKRAARHGTPSASLPARGPEGATWPERADRLLREHGAEVVVLAGYLAVLPGPFTERWAGRIINVHPSLLPRHGGRGFYGPRVLRAVLAAPERETGVTVHLVTAEVDGGPILEQRRLTLAEGESAETLRERLRPLELAALESVLGRFAEGDWPLP
ncbi:MAG: formyltransferase family protein, partial [Thermoplasmata archaeon]